MKDLFDLYQALKLKTKEEKELISENDFEALKEKLVQKNDLIELIDQINVQQYFAKLAFSLNKKQLQAKKDSLAQLIKAINTLQSQNIKALENKKRKTKKK